MNIHFLRLHKRLAVFRCDVIRAKPVALPRYTVEMWRYLSNVSDKGALIKRVVDRVTHYPRCISANKHFVGQQKRGDKRRHAGDARQKTPIWNLRCRKEFIIMFHAGNLAPCTLFWSLYYWAYSGVILIFQCYSENGNILYIIQVRIGYQ